ncbi:OprO/OprP family phosphate-selective porin [Fulvivirga maritima]|uniref:porin n=1 Tax=Fulvivirga maritima TaxID=2904247 RepID=UPI001F3290CB|nr:porin [Fulvivirga maritima]UII25325.1 OprO/OprP family phosphate-selective porin [Fulvivirga maritima]
MKLFASLIILICFTTVAKAQIIIPLDSTQKQYLKISGSGQFWLRYTDLNPGSLVKEEAQSSVTDFSVRRLRIKVQGKLTNNFGFVFQGGQNNINTAKKENTFKILDAYGFYEFKPWLKVGVGKSAWVGLSRYTAPATASQLSSDIYFSTLAAINVYDDMMRRPSLFTYGQVGKIDYRLILAKPYNDSNPVTPKSGQATFSSQYSDYQTSWYIKYQFMDKEKQSSSFAPQYYTSRKNIFNIGVGHLYQPSATWSLEQQDTVFHSMNMHGLDVFCQTPLLPKIDAIFYGSYINSDLGENFIRNIAPNNICSGTNEMGSYSGSGNAYPAAGTGSIFTAQIACNYHLTQSMIQPAISMQYADYDILDDEVVNYDFCINYYPDMKHSKLTLALQSRPIFESNEGHTNSTTRKNLFLLQYQFKF